MVTTMVADGPHMEKHHHEVAPSQHELGIKSSTRCSAPPTTCRSTNTSSTWSPTRYGKTATFMPKPVLDDNGSGMHTHQSIWKDGKPTVCGRSGYADLSETCLLLYRRHHQARQGNQRLHQSDHQQLQAAGARLRGAGAARLLGAQPLGIMPHSLCLQPQRQARRSALSRPGSQSRIWPSLPC